MRDRDFWAITVLLAVGLLSLLCTLLALGLEVFEIQGEGLFR